MTRCRRTYGRASGAGALVLMIGGPAVLAAQAPTTVEGCWVTDRALADPTPENGTPTRRDPVPAEVVARWTIRLLPDGRLQRVGYGSERWYRESRWYARNDSLEINLTQGFADWRITVVTPPGGAAVRPGIAEWISDSRAPDAPYPTLPVWLVRLPCDDPRVPPLAPLPGTPDARVVGCYLPDRRLGASADTSGLPPNAAGDSAAAWAWTIRLHADGGVARGRVRLPWSSWSARGDTVHVTVGHGGSGWRLSVLPAAGAGRADLVGTATYLTDVRVVGQPWVPPRSGVRLTRVPCTDR